MLMKPDDPLSFFLFAETMSPKYKNKQVGFEVITAVVMKSSIFWDITPCNSLEIKRRFGGTCHIHPYAGNKHNSACYPLHTGFFPGLFFDLEDEDDIFHRNIS
jgi:hypothetical protein